jgi:predicted nucleic acid-binding Zn ribbon protein
LLDKRQGLVERLREGAAGADRALQAVRDELPDGLGARVWGAAVRDGTLTVLVDSAAWATRIRYQAPGLRDAVARRLGVDLRRMLVRARPAGATPGRAR